MAMYCAMNWAAAKTYAECQYSYNAAGPTVDEQQAVDVL